MSNKPNAITESEIRELAELEALREMWGAENVSEMIGLLREAIFAARFDYSPNTQSGYVGDVFLLMGDALGEPLTLIRDSETARLRLL